MSQQVWPVLVEFLWWANAVVLLYFVLLNGVYLVTTTVAFWVLRRHADMMKTVDVEDLIGSPGLPSIAIIAPAYNEEETCVGAVEALLQVKYPRVEVVVVNDGSRDRTLERLTLAYDLVASPRAPTGEIRTAEVRGIYHSTSRSNLWVIDKVNGGKADALNVGVNYCRAELFCAIDADTLLERDALIRVARPFLTDATTVASGGIIRIVNDSRVRAGSVEEVVLPRSRLAKLQVLEYLRAFLSGRMGWSAMNAMLIISGAFGLFRRATVVKVGGYSTDTVGEDMELVIRLHRYCLERKIPYKVSFVPDPVAWTQCPETLKGLGTQRDRWQRGLLQSLWRHRGMFLNPKYGRVGMLAYPYFLILEGYGPLIELAGYAAFFLTLATERVSGAFVLAFLSLAFLMGAALSVAAVALEELTFRRYERTRDLIKLLLLGLIEPFGYRQLSTWWRVKGVVSFLRGVQRWGVLERKSFAPIVEKGGTGGT